MECGYCFKFNCFASDQAPFQCIWIKPWRMAQVFGSLYHHLLPLRVHIHRKLGLELESGLEPRHPQVLS